MKNCLLTPITSILALAAASSFGAVYDYNFTTTLPTNVDWFDVGWEATETTQTRDRYYVNIINADAANIYIDKGMNADIADSACMYTQGDTRIVIGSPDDAKTTEMHFITDGTKDTFLEVTQRSSIVVRQNGILTLDANRSLRNWSTSNELPSDFIHVLVDGGTFNGNIYTQAPANAGFFNIVFRNGATMNRGTEVNPLGINGKSTLAFDNSAYNVWNANSSYNNGFGNHLMNTGSDNQDYRQTVTLANGAVWNGAGVVANSEVAYYDFSTDITSSGMSGADLTLQLGRATSEDSYFKFQILNGSKISAKSVILSAQDGTKSQHTMGSFTFEMQGQEGNVSTLAAFGSTNMNLARTNAESTWSNNFLMKGHAKYQTVGGMNIGSNSDFGGTGNLILSGEGNIFQIGGNFNLNGGWNNANVSEAKINVSIADAANSSFSVNGINIYSNGNSQIDVRLVGATNTVSLMGGGNLNLYSSQIEGDSSATVEIGVPGAAIATTGGFRLANNMQGSQLLILSNGVQITAGSAKFSQSSIEGGTAASYYVIKDGSSLTTNNDNGYDVQSSAMRSGEVGFLLEGNGSSFISKGQMNINPGNAGNTGGIYAIRLHGTNGLFEAQKNLHFTGLFQGDKAMYLLEMLGSGNTANVNTFNIGNNNSTAGTYRFYSKSDSAENKNGLYLSNNNLVLEGQTVESTAKREFILAGNTILRAQNGGGILLKVHEYAGKNYLGGEGLFEVRGSGNDALFTDALFGNGVATAGTATLRIAGGGSHIECANFRMARGAETSWENPIGGILEFLFDDTGITSIQANNGINGSLNGLIKIDFTGMQGNYQDERFVLMTVNQSNLESLISQYWYDFISQEALDNLRLITRGLEDEYCEFAVEDSTIIDGYKDFVVYYTGTSVIPEPSTFAAIFGALAIAFALYRRRR